MDTQEMGTQRDEIICQVYPVSSNAWTRVQVFSSFFLCDSPLILIYLFYWRINASQDWTGFCWTTVWISLLSLARALSLALSPSLSLSPPHSLALSLTLSLSLSLALSHSLSRSLSCSHSLSLALSIHTHTHTHTPSWASLTPPHPMIPSESAQGTKLRPLCYPAAAH